MEKSSINKKINIDNNTKKTPEKTLEILDFDEVLDISLDADVNTIINPDSSGTFSSSKENLSASDIKQETNNDTISPSEVNRDSLDNNESKKEGKSSGILNEAKELAKDNKGSTDKPVKGEKLGDKKDNENNNSQKKPNKELNKAIDDAKEAAKPVMDEAKKAANQAKEQGKKAAAKAGGAAITAATGGVVPPKLGEWASKKALDMTEEKLKKKAGRFKSELSEKVKNSEALQNVKNKAGETVNKVGKTIKAIKTIKTIKVIAPVVLAVLGVALVMGLITAGSQLIQSYLPGSRGDINDEVQSENYSNRDQKILDKIKEINKKYPNADASLVMAAVSYPYYETLQSNELATLSKKKDEETEEIADEETEEEEENFFESNDSSYEEDDLTTDEETEELENDPYLNLYSKYKYRKKFEELIKVYNEQGEEGFNTYLKENYFTSDEGYKKMFSKFHNDNKTEAEDIIIEDIKDSSELFSGYITDIQVCYTSLVSVGQVDTSEILKNGSDNILIDIKEETCKTSNIGSCGSWYSSPINIGEYIKGVVWTEISINKNTDKEQIKAQMVAAKSYVLGRYKTMGWSLSKTETGAYVIPIRPNTNDQDYCDYKTGCQGKLSGNKHGAANQEEQKILDDAWQATKDIYVVNKTTNDTAGSYCADRRKTSSYDCSWCKVGRCLSQTELKTYESTSFETILLRQYSDYGLVTMTGDSGTMQVGGAEVCSDGTANKSALRNKVSAFALNLVGKIPYYENGLATSKNYDENNFGIDVEPDANENTKKGLGSVGFINFVYWNTIEENFGNTNDFQKVISEGHEITRDKLLVGDIGYSKDMTVVGIYIGENRWVLEDLIEGNVIAAPDDRLTKFLRLNVFANETYNYTIRTNKPTVAEWSGSNMLPISSTNYLGECPWYARNRAYEIIRELYSNGSLTKKQYDKFYKRLNDTRGNGGDFYPGNSSADKGYPGSTNIDDVRAGAFMGMTSGSIYGHVAIIEYANPEEDKIIVTDGWASGNYCTYSNYSCINFNKKEYSYKEFKNKFGNRFKGFLFFLEE